MMMIVTTTAAAQSRENGGADRHCYRDYGWEKVENSKLAQKLFFFISNTFK